MRIPVVQLMATVALAVAAASGCATPQESRRPIGATTQVFAEPAETQIQSISDSPQISAASFNAPEAEDAAINSDDSESLPMVHVAEPPTLAKPGSESTKQSRHTFDLETLVGMAVSSNPTIAQAEAAVAQASGIHCQVGLSPNPTLGYFGQEIGNEGTAGQHGLYASQTVVRGDKLNWNRCVTSQDVKRLRWEVEVQRRRVETDVRISFYRALTAQQKLRRAQAFRADAERAVQVARKRLTAQEGSKPDLLQSQLLVDQIDLSIRQSELDWEAAWTELAATVGQASMQPCELLGDFVAVESPDSEELYQRIATASPQLSAAQARIDRARLNLQRQKNQPIPNLQFQFGLGVDDSSDDAFANIQMGMPIPVHNQNQGNISAAQAEYASASRNFQRLELQLRRDLAEVNRRYQSAAVAVRQYETTMMPKAVESLALVEKAREAGEVEFLRVLTARQVLFDLQQQLIAARGNLSQADAELKGFLLTNALGTEVNFGGDDGLRGQALSGQ